MQLPHAWFEIPHTASETVFNSTPGIQIKHKNVKYHYYTGHKKGKHLINLFILSSLNVVIQ